MISSSTGTALQLMQFNNPASTKNMTTLYLKKTLCPSPLRRGFCLIALTCFALSPMARAVNPAPDGGYPNGNTAEGDGALFSLTTGEENTAVGFNALQSNATGNFNTAIGFRALYSNTTGFDNTAIGDGALLHNTTGWGNTGIGDALYSNTTGSYNTANGGFALYSNTTGSNNTANGYGALVSNTTGKNNTASGTSALDFNTSGTNNAANGYQALYRNSVGNRNIANGINALRNNTTGNSNMASGFNALANNTTGSSNLALGDQAGVNLTTGNDNIDIANAGVAGESGTLRIGNGKQTAAYIRGIYGQTVASGVGVIINSTGHLGTMQSSARFKQDIKPMDKASEAILALKPVTFRYKEGLDPDHVPQFGLIAEEVEKVNPELVVHDEEGKVNTVRYDAVNAMLLNEFLKEHRKVQDLEKQVEALTATVQKVSNQLELNKSAQQVVASNQ